ncbi:MAG: sensor histidine kinase [Burkholderiaceae bacterium]|nr:sensor histidine kinase [Burkholderiaceae bacterium]
MNAPAANPWARRWQRFSAASVRGFHAYAGWLVGISWKRFFVLSLLLLLVAGLLQHIPPFSWTYTRTIERPADVVEPPPPPPKPGDPARTRPKVQIGAPGKPGKDGVEIVIDERGVRITPRPAAAASAASAASAPQGGGEDSKPAPVVDIRLPPGATGDAVREAVEEARQAIEEAVREAQQESVGSRRSGRQREVHEVSLGEFLPTLAMLWIVASAIVKITYQRQIRAEAQAAQAVETAESESLKRQVVEARMAAMQAQVEPHFLFNTLASIDHLIEVDPKRASQMQRNLIALLRASMPTMRETGSDGANGGAVRDLGRELAVTRPYLEILKMRMEERLATEIDVPDGLLSAEFPPMMLQTLVENAIKHGLEPKPEGGRLAVKAEVVHGKLAVTVADTGLGFGRAATAGTGVGLANIRERLQLLYGRQAALTISENPGGGTRVLLALPYRPVGGAP